MFFTSVTPTRYNRSTVTAVTRRYEIFELIVYISIVMNAFLMTFTSRVLDEVPRPSLPVLLLSYFKCTVLSVATSTVIVTTNHPRRRRRRHQYALVYDGYHYYPLCRT